MSSAPHTTTHSSITPRASRRAGRRFYPSATASKPQSAEMPQSTEQLGVELASYFKYKPWVDRLITASLMFVAIPVMTVVGIAILIKDGRPVFYRQTRVGKNGRTFRIWKFRTMQQNAESQTGAVWSCASDPRVTQLGQWLRSSHLDELPQFFNVLVGDMNLIGPRPERPEFVSELSRELPFYLERIKAAPGITGLAQIRNGYDHSVADVRQKVLVDLEYLRSTSFLTDIKLLAQTCLYVVGHLRSSRLTNKRSSQATDQLPMVVSFISPQACVGQTQRELAICPLATTERLSPFASFIDSQIGALATQRLLGNDIEECA